MTQYKTHKFRLAAWLVTLAVLVVGSSVQASWQCVNGTRCPNGMPVVPVPTSGAGNHARVAQFQKCQSAAVQSARLARQWMPSPCALRATQIPDNPYRYRYLAIHRVRLRDRRSCRQQPASDHPRPGQRLPYRLYRAFQQTGRPAPEYGKQRHELPHYEDVPPTAVGLLPVT
jgi:hypothetical protein